MKIGSVVLDYVGKEIIILDAAPFIDKESNKTLAPLRAISNIFGATIDWIYASRKVIIKLDGKTITLTIGKREVYVNNKLVLLDTYPIIVNGRTFVPLRFISEEFDSEVIWRQPEKKIIITK